jgi:hypothetical protein
VKLSAGKILITGVASHPTGLVAHPETRRAAQSVSKQLKNARSVESRAKHHD